MNGKFISYLRVSTDRQGRSGLGIEGQKEAVAKYLNGGDWQQLAEFIEVESGKNADRPELAKALVQCRVMGATLIVANVSRLTRSVAFLSRLLEAGVVAPGETLGLTRDDALLERVDLRRDRGVAGDGRPGARAHPGGPQRSHREGAPSSRRVSLLGGRTRR